MVGSLKTCLERATDGLRSGGIQGESRGNPTDITTGSGWDPRRLTLVYAPIKLVR